MVKGVSRSVIEIKNTEDGYIEGAILFITPDKANDSEGRIKAKAAAFLRRTDRQFGSMPLSRCRNVIRWVMSLLLSFLSGAALMYGMVCWI